MKKIFVFIVVLFCLHIQPVIACAAPFIVTDIPEDSCCSGILPDETAGSTACFPLLCANNLTCGIPPGIPGNMGSPVKITLSFAGDCTLGTDEDFSWNNFDQVYQKVNNPAYFFEGVKSIFERDDFTLVNLEGALTTATEKEEKEFNYKGDPAYAEILVHGSVEGVTLANNHTFDFLEVGFQDTVKALNKQGVAYTHFETAIIKEIRGMKIGFLGYKGWGYEKSACTLLQKQVAEMRAAGVDFIVANYHWGDMRVYEPTGQQIRMAHFAIDHGADLVLGHHPHVLQGLETYKGKNIVYSLGNFCYGGSPVSRDADTIIYQQTITFSPSSGTILNLDHRIIPAHVTATPEKNTYQPVLAEGNEKSRILIKFKRLCGQLVPHPYSPDIKLPGRNRWTAGRVYGSLE
jgi:poly-gamma-glutamate synthesis protein (capsule biosynthesis protein)